MSRNFFILCLVLFLCSCGSSKKAQMEKEPRTVSVPASPERTAEGDIPASADQRTESIINTALTFSGVRYKYGGTDKRGIDCSGLLYRAFGAHEVSLPRVSHQIAEMGKRIRVDDVEKGDLLFFRTSKRGRKINHVGLVVAVEGGDIKFIHSTTSRGVIVSSLREGYWNYAFVKATRVL